MSDKKKDITHDSLNLMGVMLLDTVILMLSMLCPSVMYAILKLSFNRKFVGRGIVPAQVKVGLTRLNRSLDLAYIVALVITFLLWFILNN